MKTALVALMGLAVAVEAGHAHAHYRSPILLSRQNKAGGNKGGAGQANNGQAASQSNAQSASETCLEANALQTGSASTGQNAAVAAEGQVNSAT